jgi:site-specific recombinase XerD
MPVKLLEATDFQTFDKLVPSWVVSLKAANKSPRTINTYQRSVAVAAEFLAQRYGVTAVALVTKAQLEAFMGDQLERAAGSTASLRYMALHVFFKWCVEADEIQDHPMAKMRPPKVEPPLVPVVPEADFRKLLKACEGRSFEAKRDSAILRVFIDTGCRLGECAGIKVTDVDFDRGVIYVSSGGPRRRLSAYVGESGFEAPGDATGWAGLALSKGGRYVDHRPRRCRERRLPRSRPGTFPHVLCPGCRA